jgi:D-alanine-D-alanine ligase
MRREAQREAGLEEMMKVGITYDLRDEYIARGCGLEETAEFDRADTIEAIERALQELGHETDRIGHIRALSARLAAGDRWELVFNIAEGLKGFGREAQVPALLEAYNVPYTFSDPLVLSLTLHKGMAKHVIRDLGIPTPDFAVIESEEDISRMDLPFPLFAKPVAEGTGKGVNSTSIIHERSTLTSTCRRLLTIYSQPVLVERYLSGREFTVGILGTGTKAAVVGVMEVILQSAAEPDVYSYRNKEWCEEFVTYRLVNDSMALTAADVALSAYRGLGCRDAGRVDLRVDEDGIPNFMEVNPLAGLHPEHSDLCMIASKVGMAYGRLIQAIIASALERHPSLRGQDESKADWHCLQRALSTGASLF